MKEEVFRLTGMNHYEDNIRPYGDKNCDYSLSKSELLDKYYEGDIIWQYEFDTSKSDSATNTETNLYEIVPEPDNEFDPNAVAVYFHGEKIGYIKKGKCTRIKKLLKSKDFKRSYLEITGGKYKKIKYDYDDDKYFVETGETNGYSGVLTILMNEEPKKEEPQKEDQNPEPKKEEPVKEEPIKPEIKEEPKKGGFFKKLFGKK